MPGQRFVRSHSQRRIRASRDVWTSAAPVPIFCDILVDWGHREHSTCVLWVVETSSNVNVFSFAVIEHGTPNQPLRFALCCKPVPWLFPRRKVILERMSGCSTSPTSLRPSLTSANTWDTSWKPCWGNKSTPWGGGAKVWAATTRR